MIVLAGGDIVLPDRVIQGGSLLIDGERIADVEAQSRPDPRGAQTIDIRGSYIVPGFIDVHVHGVEGIDTLDEGDAITQIAARLPRYGVTAFCPTTVACDPPTLAAVLGKVSNARTGAGSAARVLAAHLESNFINPEYKGAQPAACLRTPSGAGGGAADDAGNFSAADVLAVIATAREHVGIVTVAPELPGGIDLIRELVAAGHRVSLGHSGADFDTAVAAIEAGARHATHLFNRMAPMTHRSPGLAGAVLARREIAAELICDGVHVHPAVARIAIVAKGVDRMMAITDGTAAAGLPLGATAKLGGQTIRVGAATAQLEDGTVAGSTLTMDRAFHTLVTRFGTTIVEAAILCATTPARELGLAATGVIERGAVADLVVLDRHFRVRHTIIGGRIVFSAPT